MKNHGSASAAWSTAVFADAANNPSSELTELRQHLDLCRGARGHLFAVRCAVQGVNGFVAARFVTTLVVLALLTGVVLLAL